MEIGKLYQIKKYYWTFYPSERAALAPLVANCDSLTFGALPAKSWTDYLSKQLNCNVSYLNPNSILCPLEVHGKNCKVLSTEGQIGWIVLTRRRNDIEEMKVE